MSENQSSSDRGARSLLVKLGLPLAIANAAITCLVLVSPFGLGSGSGFIGYSIYRLLIYGLVQLPLAALGITGAIAAWLKGRSQWIGLVLHFLVVVAAFFFYFDQGRTICRLMTC